MVEYKPRKNTYIFNKYIGTKDDEEYYFKPITFDCNWYWGGAYVEGLRPYTEEELRIMASEAEPEDIYSKEVTENPYFDRDKFYEAMEEDWYENADVQREVQRGSETIYLCFGTHTHADSIFLNDTTSYAELQKYFDEGLALTKEEYNMIVPMLKYFYHLREKANKFHQAKPDEYIAIMKEIERLLEMMEKWNNSGKFNKEEMKKMTLLMI